jgi:hypothetical protein
MTSINIAANNDEANNSMSVNARGAGFLRTMAFQGRRCWGEGFAIDAS